MAKGSQRVVISDEGEVVVDDSDMRFRLRGQSGDYLLVAEAAGLLIMRKVLPSDRAPAAESTGTTDEFDALFDDALLDSPTIEGEVRVIVAGEVLTAMTLFQIIEVIANRNWDGDLRVLSNTGAVFEITFAQGALKGARSNEQQDLLGQTLIKEGVLTQTELEEVLNSVSGERRLGDVLIDNGYVDHDQLFEYLGKQIKGVFFRALLVPDGSYIFTTPDPAREPPAHTVHLLVRGLLMEGIQRVDEMELFRETIPTPDIMLRRRNHRIEGLDENCLAVLPYCNEKFTLRRIAELTGLGEFLTTKAAYHLVKRKRVDAIMPRRVDAALLDSFVDGLDAITRTIFSTIAEHGDPAMAQSTLSAWVTGSGYSHFFGEELSQDGALDVERLKAAVQNAQDEHPMETLRQIGHEMVSFALFSAGSVLPREAEKRLSLDVNQRLTQLRAR